MSSDVVRQYVEGLNIHTCSRAFLREVRKYHKKDLDAGFYGALTQWTGIDEDRLKRLLSSGNMASKKPDLCGYEITALLGTMEEFNLKTMFGVPEKLDDDSVVHDEFTKYYQGLDKATMSAKTPGHKRRMLYEHCFDLCLQRYPISPGESPPNP
jgi:hypothetical protein